jgi:flagellar basal-body rod protein FlgG
MTTLQGSISKLVTNSNAMFESFGYISSNVANLNTNGFKAQRFETFLNVDGSLEGKLRTDYSKGSLVRTTADLDVGIDGAGFIPVTNKNGETAYTRDGSFAVNAEGYMVTSDGWLVADGIKIPVNYHKLKIQPDGTVTVLKSNDTTFEKIGKIPLVSFNNPEGLKKVEGNKVAPTNESGQATLIAEHLSIKQGMLEKSNVDIFSYVNESLKLNGSLIASTRLVRVVDEIYRQSINLRQ